MRVLAIAALWCVAPCFAFEFPVLYQFRHDCGPSGCLAPTTLKRTTVTTFVTICGKDCFSTVTTTPKIVVPGKCRDIVDKDHFCGELGGPACAGAAAKFVTGSCSQFDHTKEDEDCAGPVCMPNPDQKTCCKLLVTETYTSTVTGTTQTGSTFSGTTVTQTTVTASTSHTSTTTRSKTTVTVTSSSTSSTSSTTTTATFSASKSATTVSSTTTSSKTTVTKTETTTATTVTSTTSTKFESTCTTTQPCVLLIQCDEDVDIADGKLTQADKTNCGHKAYVIEKESPTVRHPMNPCKPNGDCWDPKTCCPDCLPIDLCKGIDLTQDLCKPSHIGTPWDCRRVTWNFLTTILQPAGQLMWVKKDGDANIPLVGGQRAKGNCQPWCKFLVHDLACTREINHCNACEFCDNRGNGQAGPETFQCQPDCTGADFNRENCLPGAQRWLECRGCAQCKTHKPCPCFRLVICECGLYLVTHRDENKYPLLYNPVNESNPLQGFKCPACLDRQGVCHNVTFGSENFCRKKHTAQFFECPGHPPALLTSFEDDLWGEGCADNDVNLHFEEPWCGDVGRGFGTKTPASSVIQGVSDPHECQKKCAAVASCGMFTWRAGAGGSSGTCSLYSSFTVSKQTYHGGFHDYTFDRDAVSGPKTCGDHRKKVESMKYSGPKTVLKIPEPDEPNIIEAKFESKVGGMRSHGQVFFFGYVAAGMGVAGLFVLAAYTVYRRAHREHNGVHEILEGGLTETSTAE